jgi:hypothetical protein
VKLTSPAARTSLGHDGEWEYAGLVEQLETLESRVDDLRAERDRLRTDLRIAQLWVKELALWLDEAHAQSREAAFGLAGLAPAPELLATLHEREAEPILWGRVASIGALVTAPWAILAGLAWLVLTVL